MQKSLQHLRNTSNSTLDNIIPLGGGYDEDDFEDYDDHDDHNHNHTLRNNGNIIEEEDDDDSEEENDENRFYYKTPPSKKAISLEHQANGNVTIDYNGTNKNGLPNGGTKFESSLIRFVLPQNNNNLKMLNFDSVSTTSFNSGK